MPKGIRMGTVEDLQNRYPGATLIKNWDELLAWAEVNKSETHVLNVRREEGCADIQPIVKTDKWSYCYLSTHAFDNFINSTKKLQKRGFNVILDDWGKHKL